MNEEHTFPLSFRRLCCFKRYEKNINNYLFTWAALRRSTDLPPDLIHKIMEHNHPRKYVNVFGMCSPEVVRSQGYVKFNMCTKCFVDMIDFQKNLFGR